MKVVIETERLIIRNLGPGDEQAVYAWAGDPEVAKYMIYPQYRSEADGIEWLQSREKDADNPDDYDLGFVLKETGELIGSGGLVYHADTDTWNIGYNIRKDAWGNGYVVEAIRGIVAEIRKTRKIHAIEGTFAVENHKSQRVMEKLGMTFYEDTEYEKIDGSAHFKAKKFRRVFTDKQCAVDAIEAKRELICSVADRIWEYAELSLQEFKSCQCYCEVLEQEGFLVERNTANIETAFTASYGSGRPVIGILAEYDALSGLSQKAGALEREEIIPGGSGHGCGHNLLGAGALAAALGVKAFLEENKVEGTVVLYGCPGEEGGAAKAFLARDGVWKDLDAAITWHPEDCNEVVTGSSNSCIQVQYKFTGIASHASGAPEKGRSALDAVELMNIGVQFLREHMSDKARVHYAITDAGGVSPNVVQPKAGVLYMIRSNHVAEAVELEKRVDKIAEGAALMTETTVAKSFIDGCSDTVTNHVLERVLYENFCELGVPAYSDEELVYADALAATYDSTGVPGIAAKYDMAARNQVEQEQADYGHAMNGFLLPLYEGEAFQAGSTDVGDVSWLTPTAQIHVASWPNGCPGHSWQNVSCDRTEIGHKAAVHAGKVMAAGVIDLFTRPELLREARKEFEMRTRDGFVCPIPKDARPVIPE